MNKIIFAVSFLFLVLSSEQCSAVILSLDEGKNYNLITRGDATLIGADSQGIIAVGGTATVQHYDVGTLGGFDKTALQVDGSLDASGDQIIKGNAIVSGVFTNSSDSVWQSPVAAWCCNIFTSGGIDIEATMDHLDSLSSQLASMPTNTTTDLKDSLLTFTPNQTNLDFYLSSISELEFDSARDFAASADLFSIDDYLIINVAGENIDLHGFGFPGNPGSLPSTNNLLFNFFEAESLALDSGAFYGNILAPNAHLNFNQGLITGSVFVDSFYSDEGAQLNRNGSFDLNVTLLDPEITVNKVSAPANLSLIALALIMLFITRQRKNHRINRI